MKALLPKIYFKFNLVNPKIFRTFAQNNRSNKPNSNENLKQDQNKEQLDKENEKFNQDQRQSDTPQAQSGKVKHIYKQKSDQEPEGIYDEAHAYKEGYDDGYYVRQRTSYVYYEYPGTGGRTAESGGKSSEANKDQEQSTQQQDKEETKDKQTQKKQQKNDSKTDKEMPEGNKKL